MLADITTPNSVVDHILHYFDHPTIPYYMVIPPEGPILYLDAIITPGQMVKAMERATQSNSDG